ncbi:hypothetical protein Tco_0748428 [Tanacetum coccineum]|uniref:Uncharacterized protein n=1 Tax=Tanacetum coccineum TaxID=301880 RepID=A0ABQ4YWE1_9ASTR
MVTIHPSSPSLPTVKIKGLSPIKGRIRQFKKSTMKWQGQMCQIKSSLLITQVQATYDEEKAQRDECWTGLHEMAMAAFKSQYIAKSEKKEQDYEKNSMLSAVRRILSIPFVDEDDYIPLGDIIARYSTSKAITPDLPIEEPDNISKYEG